MRLIHIVFAFALAHPLFGQIWPGFGVATAQEYTEQLQQFGEPKSIFVNNQNLQPNLKSYNMGYMHDDGTSFIFFTANDYHDDNEYEYDHARMGLYCYVMKLDSAGRRVWTSSMRHAQDFVAFSMTSREYHAYTASLQAGTSCFPYSIQKDPASLDHLVFLYEYRHSLRPDKRHEVRGSISVFSKRYEISTGVFDREKAIFRGEAFNGRDVSQDHPHNYLHPSLARRVGMYGLPSLLRSLTLSPANMYYGDDTTLGRTVVKYTRDGTIVWSLVIGAPGRTYGDDTDRYAYFINSNLYIIDAATSDIVSRTNSVFSSLYPAVKFVWNEDGPGNHTLFAASLGANSDRVACGLSLAKVPNEASALIAVFKLAVSDRCVGVWATYITLPSDSPTTEVFENCIFMQSAIDAHWSQGVFVVGASKRGSVGLPNNGRLDYFMLRLDYSSGSILKTFTGGTSADDRFFSVSFNINSGRPPFVTGLTGGDVDGPGPGTFYGPDDDIVYGIIDSSANCSPGYYKTGIPPCAKCPTGYYTDEGGLFICKVCGVGKQTTLVEGATSCDDCPAGTFTNQEATQICPKCPPGFSSVPGKAECTPCARGTAANSPGSENVCPRCEIGYYADVEGLLECKLCPGESSTEGGASTDPRMCECAEETFGDPFGVSGTQRDCTACPKKSKCSKRGMRMPQPSAGYWLTSDDPLEVLRCSPSEACPGQETDTCTEGYKGTACQLCDSGYYLSSGLCVQCPEVSVYQVLLLSALSIIFLFLVLGGVSCFVACLAISRKIFGTRGFKAVKRLRAAYVRLQRTTVKYGLKYIQVVNVVMGMDAAWPVEVNIFRRGIFTISSSLSISSIIQLDCTDMDETSAGLLKSGMQVTFVVIVIGGLISITVVSLLVTLISPRLSKKFLLGHVVSSSLVGFNMIYITVHTSIISVFACYEVKSGQYSMISAPSVQCFTLDGMWPYYAAISLIGFVAISVGFPAGLLTLLAVRRRMSVISKKLHPFWYSISGFLVDPYKDNYHWFEIIPMAEKFLIPMSTLLTPLGSSFQACYLCLIVLNSFGIYFRWDAFRLWDEWVWAVVVSYASLVSIVAAAFASAMPSDSECNSAGGNNTTAMSWLLTFVVYTSGFMVLSLAIVTLLTTVLPCIPRWRCCRKPRTWRPSNKMDEYGSMNDANSRVLQSDNPFVSDFDGGSESSEQSKVRVVGFLSAGNMPDEKSILAESPVNSPEAQVSTMAKAPHVVPTLANPLSVNDPPDMKTDFAESSEQSKVRVVGFLSAGIVPDEKSILAESPVNSPEAQASTMAKAPHVVPTLANPLSVNDPPVMKTVSAIPLQVPAAPLPPLKPQDLAQ